MGVDRDSAEVYTKRAMLLANRTENLDEQGALHRQMGLIFHTMHKMGLVGENPFEGTVNDVPISQISRIAEIEVMDLSGVDPDDQPQIFPIERDVVM